MDGIVYVNATKICQFKAKDSKIKDHTLCLGNILQLIYCSK